MGYNVAIDGPAGAGKSTIAKQVAKENGYIYVDTGAMYRGLAIHFLNLGIDPKDTEKIIEACKDVEVTIGYESGIQQIYVNGENVTAKLRTEEVGNMASMTSAIPEVRGKLLELQRTLAREKDVIMDGRDIGTHVLPDADVKIYLTASVEIRAKRRYKELVEKGVQCDLKEIEKDIEERDYRDMTRKIAPLKKAEDASLSKTSFLHNMSHDIRTPMNAILGYAHLMRKELTDPKLLHYQEMIEESGSLLLSIINNVLDMTKIESGRLELNEDYNRVGDVVGKIVAVFQGEARKKNLTLTRVQKATNLDILCDVTKLQELFTNLISNAVKYTPPGGTVTVTTEELPCAQPGHVTLRTEVADTGIGISREFLPHLFEPFSRERNTTAGKVLGTGLGMPIVRSLVELMGGTITVESEQGKGSKFTVTLTHKLADQAHCEKTPAGTEEQSDHCLTGKRLLLAKDNDLNAEIATAFLQDMGFTVDRAVDGADCVDRYQHEAAGTYGLILMDIQMPNMDGYQATKLIRNLSDGRRTIPIIAMTANAFDEDRQKALSVGMDAHLAKPVDVERLFGILRKVIR